MSLTHLCVEGYLYSMNSNFPNRKPQAIFLKTTSKETLIPIMLFPNARTNLIHVHRVIHLNELTYILSRSNLLKGYRIGGPIHIIHRPLTNLLECGLKLFSFGLG